MRTYLLAGTSLSSAQGDEPPPLGTDIGSYGIATLWAGHFFPQHGADTKKPPQWAAYRGGLYFIGFV